MKNFQYLIIALLLLTAACQSEKETPSGLKYTVVKTGTGKTAETNQILVFDYQMKDSKDSVWADTFKDGVSAASMIADTSKLKTEDGMTQMFRELSKGDSVKTTMTVSHFFTKLVNAPVPPGVDSTRSITYYIKVHDIIPTLGEYYKYRDKQVAGRDDKAIEKYLADNKITAQSDTSGLRYIMHTNLGGEKPVATSCVEISYRGKFMKNGRVFDQNEKISYPLAQFIQGWKIGITKLGKGDSASLFVPSRIAYGAQGYPGAIPPDAILIFDVKLLDFKNEYDEHTKTCK
ncbi:MAG: FKBP-type peptidyl-prolyl cis-trans isomerase [Bacteroidota bacterium]